MSSRCRCYLRPPLTGSCGLTGVGRQARLGVQLPQQGLHGGWGGRDAWCLIMRCRYGHIIIKLTIYRQLRTRDSPGQDNALFGWLRAKREAAAFESDILPRRTEYPRYVSACVPPLPAPSEACVRRRNARFGGEVAETWPSKIKKHWPYRRQKAQRREM